MMKTIAISGLTALACLMGTAGMAQAQQMHEAAQQAQEYSYPSRDGSYSPPSTLRITEQPQAGTAAPSSVVRDTPESLAQYERCRNNADRAAVDRAQLQNEVAACLRELEARRQQ